MEATDPETFEVVLYSVGDRRGDVVQTVSAVTGFAPDAAGQLVERADPAPVVRRGLRHDEAREVVTRLEAVGARAYVADSRDTYEAFLGELDDRADHDAIVARIVEEIGVTRPAARRIVSQVVKSGRPKSLAVGLSRARADRIAATLSELGARVGIMIDETTSVRRWREDWQEFEKRFGPVDHDETRIDDTIRRLEAAFRSEFGNDSEFLADRSADVHGHDAEYLLHWEGGRFVLWVYNPRFDYESEDERGVDKAGERMFDGVVPLIAAPYQVKINALVDPVRWVAHTLDDGKRLDQRRTR